MFCCFGARKNCFCTFSEFLIGIRIRMDVKVRIIKPHPFIMKADPRLWGILSLGLENIVIKQQRP
jgi:hypothetical protein